MIWPCFWSQPKRIWGKKTDLNAILEKRLKQVRSPIPDYCAGSIPWIMGDYDTYPFNVEAKQKAAKLQAERENNIKQQSPKKKRSIPMQLDLQHNTMQDWTQEKIANNNTDDSLSSPDAWKDEQNDKSVVIQDGTITDIATQMQMEIRKTNRILKEEIDNLVANHDTLGQEEVCKSMITECLNNVATFLHAFSVAVERVFAHEMNDIRVVQLQTAIQQHKIIIDNTLNKYAKLGNNDTACDGNGLLDIYRSLYGFNLRIDGLFTDIVKHGCPDYIADVLKSNGHVTDYKFVDKSNAKMLLVKIPEKLFKHSGYKSVEPMMERLEQMGVIVAAVPESINLYEVSEKDLNSMELMKVSDFNRRSIPFFDDVPPQPNK